MDVGECVLVIRYVWLVTSYKFLFHKFIEFLRVNIELNIHKAGLFFQDSKQATHINV